MSSESPEEGDFDDAALFGEDSVSDDSPASDDAVAEVTPAAVPAAATAAAGHYTVGEHPAIIFCDECGNIMKPEASRRQVKGKIKREIKFKCHNCDNINQHVNNVKIYENILHKTVKMRLKEYDSGLRRDVSLDRPNLTDDIARQKDVWLDQFEKKCNNGLGCNNHEAVTILAGGDDMSLVFICTSCGEKWVVPKDEEQS